MADKKIKSTEPVGYYTVFDDHKADVRVTRTICYNQSSDDETPETWFYKAQVGYNGGPPLIWRGYDLGAKPYNGYGDTTESALIDLLRTVNRQVENRMDVTDLVRLLVNEKRQDAMPGEMPS